MQRGFVCLWRRILDSEVFADANLLKVFVWCILRANYKKRYVSLKVGTGTVTVKLDAGQFVFGRHSASQELNMPPSTVWKRLKRLKGTGKLNIESHRSRNRGHSIITINKWETYQDQIKSREQRKKETGEQRSVVSRGQAGNIDNHLNHCNNGREEEREEIDGDYPVPDMIVGGKNA